MSRRHLAVSTIILYSLRISIGIAEQGVCDNFLYGISGRNVMTSDT